MHPIRPREHGDILSLSSALPHEHSVVALRIRQYVELGVKTCGSAASLARRLHVTPPTVCQWRSGRRRPDAVHLIRIQDLVGCPRQPGAPRSRSLNAVELT